ncbi:hypothetical protein VMCG_07676 [Cytospora schulzeri]|uniref:Uncharacterized protein n=1 Tax=Cytospora schulzeri TaxID=448051 RepID=A0A423VYY2_9PEZI|nr:hypothetical protein VMCG_07676 [Valsa malicola]
MADDARPADKIEIQHVEPTHDTDSSRGYRKFEQPECSQETKVTYEDQAVGYKEYREALEVDVTEKQ